VAVSLAKVASEVKAADIRVLFVKPIVYWTEFFIILTAFSNAQIEAIRCPLLFLLTCPILSSIFLTV
jgi:ribosomal silencing factor RsfS